MSGQDARLYAASYEPGAADLRRSLPEIADGLQGQLYELGARPSVERAEKVAANLAGAHRAILRLREALLREGTGDGS